MRRFLFLLLFVPLAIVVVVMSVANRAPATFSLDPFGGLAPALSVSGPLFVFLFIALALGVIIGGTATWVRQGAWRQRARRERAEAERVREEVERLRERVAALTPSLPPTRDAA
jgi:uncharacterized integral membrane protein